ncbi:MAG: hypothetical protein WBW88_08205, partial [Rhodothermales bacterium]
LPGLVKLTAYEGLCLSEQVKVSRAVLLHRLTGGLVHNKEMIVKEKNLHDVEFGIVLQTIGVGETRWTLYVPGSGFRVPGSGQ